MNTSRISSRVTPFLSAPAMCSRSSWGRFRQLIIARFSMLRVFLSRPSRPHTAPQQYSVTSSCIGMLKSSAALNAASTNSLPSTALRMARPFSNVALSMSSPWSLVLGAWFLVRSWSVLGPSLVPWSVFGPSLEPACSRSLDRYEGPGAKHQDQGSFSAPNLHVRPFLDHLRDRREIGIGAKLCLRDRQHLPHCGAGDHRYTERFGFIDAKTHVLVRKPGREPEVEGSGQNRLRELVLRGAVASAAGVDDVDQHLRVETRL